VADKKPGNILIINVILAMKAFVFAATIIVFIFIKDVNPNERSFLSGMRRAIYEKFNLKSEDAHYFLGYLIGQLLIPIILTGLIFVFLKERKFWPMIIVVILDILYGLPVGIPVLSILILILVCSLPARNYFKGIENNPEDKVLL
jgi:hypothetical protein